MLGSGSPPARYGVAAIAVGLVAMTKVYIDPFMESQSPFLLFALATMFVAWFGGLGPGLFATALALVVVDYLFLDPAYSFKIDGSGHLLNLAIFALVGIAASVLVASMRAARRRSVASEERFRLLVQGARDYAIVMLTAEGRVEGWNEGARRTLGYSEEEIMGEHFSVFFTPEDRRNGRPERQLRLAIDGDPVSEETWAVRKDGKRIWANGSTDAVRDEGGNLKGVVKVLRDRTEARRAEEELRLRDRAMAASANGIVITDPNQPDNPVVYANPAFIKMTGYATEEVLGYNCRFLQGEERDQPAVGELREAIRAGRGCEVVLRNYKKDGTLFFNELTLSPVFDDDGGITRFVGILDDVTEQRRADEALKRSEERYRAVIEQSTEGIFLVDTRTRRLLETNPAFQRMLGYTPEELRGMELYDLVAHSSEEVDANIGRTLGEGRRLIGERSYRRKDGAIVEVDIGASTISYNSHRAICATVRDITARKRAEGNLKRSEERFRSLVRYASDIIVILDASGTILYESPAVERVLGFTAEERVGSNAFGLLHPEDQGPVSERFGELAGEPGARITAEYRIQNSEGEWRHFEAIGANLLGDPVIGGIVVNSRDVTERKRNERAVAEIRDAERGRIARELHDGVLQDLSYTAQTMEVARVKYEGTGVETDLDEATGAIRRATRDLRGAIYDLRAYRHGEQGTRELFESLVELNRRRMPGRNLTSELEEDLLERFSGRGAVELLRVVQEALTNVRRHSGAANVGVSIFSVDDRVIARVSDDGRGFDPEELPPGIGTLGMRERSLGLGGRLSIESEPGAGTTVRFEVPLENLLR